MTDEEEDVVRLARMSLTLTGSRRGGGSSVEIRGVAPAIRVARVLFEEAWGRVRVTAESSPDPRQFSSHATITYHPADARRLQVLLVDGNNQWSVVRSASRPLTIPAAAEAAVRLVARLPLAHGQRLDPILKAEVERTLARPERTRLVGCDCGGLRLHVPSSRFCWREAIDPSRRYRSHYEGKPATRRERVVEAIERFTFGLI